MKKVLSVLLSVLMVVLTIVPAMSPIIASAAKSSDAYSVIFTASDFQSDDCYNNFTAMMNNAQADGITETPEAFLFGGDYTAGSEDPATQVPKITDTVQSMYSGYDEDNLIYVQGNHDTANEVLTPTGLYEFENFFVYSINEDDFQKEQAGRDPLYDETVMALADSVAAEFEQIKQSGDTRPIFVITHVPLHHTSRDDYGDNVYSKYLFEVLNEYGEDLDIIFLFGHNHSSTYDDYIGGAVNYIAKGETIRIPVPDESQMGANGYTDEELNFTYMNCGYVAYSNNSTTAPSTNTLTMGAFELCPTTIEISRYSTEGLYTTETITRVNPSTTDPYVRVSGGTTGKEGNSDILYGYSGNIEVATYTWSSSDDSVVKVLSAGKNAQVIYTGEGTADVTLTVTDTDGNKYTDKKTITVAGATTAYNPVVSLKRGTTDVDGRKLKFYEVTYGEGFMLDGSFTGFVDNVDNVTTAWSSTNPAVATVENGYVTFVSSGETTINYVVTDGTTTVTKSVNLLISRAAKPVDTYELTNDFQPGKSYIIANVNTAGEAYIMGTPSTVTGMNGYNIRMTAVPVTIDEINGTPTIINSNDSVVWNAVSTDNGKAYLVNELYGTYLYANNDATGDLDLDVTTDKTVNGTIWSQYSSGFLVSDEGYGMHYSADVNFRACASGSISKQFIYEKTTTVPFTRLKCDNEYVDGVTKTIYSVNGSTTKTVKGSYVNFGEDVTVQWISSDPNVATVDENGVVSFKGIDGTVDITYLVTDQDGNKSSATVTFDAKTTKEPLRAFKYTTTVKPGKKYVVVSSNSTGAAYLMLGKYDTTTHLEQQYVFVQTDVVDENVFVELSEDDLAPVWTTESTGADGYYYFKNELDGKYLWAGTAENAVSTDASLTTHDEELYKWTYNTEGIYNEQVNSDTSTHTGLRLSGSGYFRINKPAESEVSNIYLYEEVELLPYVHIRSKYMNVENTTLERFNVAPYQSETLMGKTEHFLKDGFVTYEWTSSNPDVATIDNAGVVTYTGNPGETTITVVAKSTIPDNDGSYDTATSTAQIKVQPQTLSSLDEFTLTDNFIPGEFYVIAPSNSLGSSVIMKNEQHKYDNEYRFNSVSCLIEKSANGLTTITNTDKTAVWECLESDTEGYYYLKNVETGEYLAFAVDNSLSPYRQIVTTADLNEGYDHDAYLIAKNSSSLIYSKQSIGYSPKNYLVINDANEFRMSQVDNKAYIYQRTLSEALAPKTQIRVSAFLGTNDITNVLQNRYNIQANDTEQLLRYTEEFASITSSSWSVSDENVATIDLNGLVTYTGKEGFVTVTLTVEGENANGETVTHTVKTTLNVSNDDYIPPTEDYPEYPHEGSVRINKTASNTAGGYNFQTSGVTEVELSVTGVPLPQAVDVVVVLDHSSSMSTDGSGLRLTNAIANTRDFALQLVNANKNNRIAIVTFDHYRNIYETLTDTTADYTTYASSNEDRIITGDGTAEGAFMTFDDSEELIAQIDSLATNNTAGTNYDYGLQQAYDILKAAKSDPDANKIQYVVFMSDGEPYAFNRVQIQYGTNDPDGAYEAWLRGDESNETLADYLADTTKYPSAQYFNTRGENWFAEIIKTPEGETLSDMPAIDYYDGYRDGLGATIFTIGFEAGEQGSLTGDILTTMASTAENYYYAEGDIQAAYDSILEQIVFAANNAVATDKMGENFSLQVAPSLTLGNNMSTITFNPAPCIEIGSWTLNSDGTRNTYTEIEKITFETESDGTLTAAYSDLIDNTNIYDATSNKIIGSKVTYDLTNETFTWNIGDITRDEITLKYYAYLEGSAEGEREAGTFDTNEYARLDYLNYLGTECQQTFPVPSLGWKEAVVSYEFYLVNDKGEPVNRNGIVVPFAERVLVGQEQSKSINLNSSADYSAISLVAKEEVPAGYVLFNEDTSYYIAVSSGDNPSRATINDNADIKTTYFRDGTIIYSGHGDVPNVTDYTNTHVSFAIKNVGGIAPDSVVIDYGLPVKISVLANDINATKGTLTLIGTKLDAGTEFNVTSYEQRRMQDGVTTSLVLPNGTASIEGDNVVFTPSNLTMNTENVFYYEYLTDTGVYMYTEVTVIPAANIYYEESFFTFNDGVGYEWKTAGETLAEKFQSEDRPGTFSFAEIDANNVYGMDHAYDDSSTYSLGSAMYTSVDANAYNKEPTAEFTFCGTGFDLFSVTNNDTGAVLVSVYKTDGKMYKNFIVQTYYGYSYEDDQFVPTPNDGCLYQVPVISARNLGYDTYRVVIKPIYSTMFDTAKDGSYDIYVDSVRIYDPAGETPTQDSVIGDAYIEDGEYAPEFVELRNTILDSETFYSSMLEGTEYGEGSVFIDGISSLDESGISDKFLEAGPNNEVYLAKGQAIAFHLVSDTEISPASVQLGMKTVFGDESVVALMNTNNLTPSYITVSGAHEMYRRLASAIVWDATALATGKYQTKYPIVIVNTSDSILSLTQLKWAFENGTGGDVQLVVDSETPRLAYAAVRSVMASFPYTDEDISMEWSDTSPEEGAEVTLTITTPDDIAKITIDGVEITEYTINANGEKEWTYTFTVVETGENTYDILLFAENGKVSQPMATETITVTEASVETNFFSVILELIKRILAFFKVLFA